MSSEYGIDLSSWRRASFTEADIQEAQRNAQPTNYAPIHNTWSFIGGWAARPALSFGAGVHVQWATTPLDDLIAEFEEELAAHRQRQERAVFPLRLRKALRAHHNNKNKAKRNR